jgi:predicted nuclease of predicted toxin-antitoxin system
MPLSFFADENIPPDLISWVKTKGYIISSVKEENLEGATDTSIIKRCFDGNQVILTQDNDFGKLIFTTSILFYSIIYLRPGHLHGAFHIPTLETIFKKKELIQRGTLIIGQRTENKIKIRVKQIQ